MSRQLLDIQTTRERLGGIGRTHVFHMIRRGELESIKIGRRRMILAESVDDYVERQVESAH